MEGFEVPIHRSLTQPILMGGVPRDIALLNGTITAALVFGMHSFLGLPPLESQAQAAQPYRDGTV